MMRNCSRYQIPTLRYIRTHDIKVEHLNEVHQGHVAFLLAGPDPLVTINGSETLRLTDTGNQVLDQYEREGFGLERQVAKALSDRVQNLIFLARKRAERKRSSAA